MRPTKFALIFWAFILILVVGISCASAKTGHADYPPPEVTSTPTPTPTKIGGINSTLIWWRLHPPSYGLEGPHWNLTLHSNGMYPAGEQYLEMAH